MTPERAAKMIEHNDTILGYWYRMREFRIRIERFLKTAGKYNHPEIEEHWPVSVAWAAICSDLRWRECHVCGDGIFLRESHGFLRHLNNWTCSAECAAVRPELGATLFGDASFPDRLDPTPDEIAKAVASLSKSRTQDRARYAGVAPSVWNLPMSTIRHLDHQTTQQLE